MNVLIVCKKEYDEVIKVDEEKKNKKVKSISFFQVFVSSGNNSINLLSYYNNNFTFN